MKMCHFSRFMGVALLALALVVCAGCKGGRKGELDTDLVPGSGATGAEMSTSGQELPDIDVSKLNFVPAADLDKVYFDTDKYTLRPDAREALKRNAERIKQTPGVYIQIEGHCDERNTQEYNLALGEKRALAVRDYLMTLGISGDRLLTISYGEEVPVALGHDEGAWSQNRRCEFNRAM